MIQATMDIPEFEMSIERSLLYHLSNSIKKVTVNGKNRDIKFYPPIPYEQFENFRLKGVVCTVEMSRVLHEGFMLGNEIPINYTGNSYVDTVVPFRYDIQFNINSYTANAMERAKVDGEITKVLQGMIKYGAPIYEFSTETSSVTAYDTGSRITIPNYNQFFFVRSEDAESHDFLSNWTVNTKCFYVYDTIVAVVTSIDLTNNIYYEQT